MIYPLSATPATKAAPKSNFDQIERRANSSNCAFFLFLWLTLLNYLLSGCSPITNTIAGLTTPQSTISGSNYVFWEDISPLDDKTPPRGLVLEQQYDSTRSAAIRAGDNFKIALDFGFLRYLQAVDPYVIIYSEAWMGPTPKPLDNKETHRQVILIKDGLTPNARLPFTGQTLLGPVTLEDGANDVNLTLKVVVLSKSNNQQTIGLLNDLAGFTSATIPGYGTAIGAAAALGATIVAQNLDKIEFEHTFTFSPTDGSAMLGPPNKKTILQTGRIIVFKGESGKRVVPYEHWGYYAWPFNWAGIRPDRASRRFEEKTTEVEFNYLNIPWVAIRLPFEVLKSLFIPAEWFPDRYGGTFPTDLKLNGQNLFCVRQQPDENSPDWRRPYTGFYNRICPTDLPYAEKTYMVFSIERTVSSHGLFSELVSKFSSHGARINELTSASSSATSRLDSEVKDAIAIATSDVLFGRAKRRIQAGARKGQFNALEDFKSLGFDDAKRLALIQLAVEERVAFTRQLYMNLASSMIENAKVNNDPAAMKRLFPDLTDQIKKTRWTDFPPAGPEKALWDKGWQLVLNNVKDGTLDLAAKNGLPDVVGSFDPTTWASLSLP